MLKNLHRPEGRRLGHAEGCQESEVVCRWSRGRPLGDVVVQRPSCGITAWKRRWQRNLETVKKVVVTAQTSAGAGRLNIFVAPMPQLGV